MQEMVGRWLGNKYRLLRLIGEGGMGAVYEAEHQILRRRVAIKVLRPAYRTHQEALQRFIGEGRATSRIEHPNIVDVQDFGQEPDGTLYIVMTLLKGRSLKAELDEVGYLTEQRVVTIAAQVLAALQAAHDNGVIHRDLKPENVFLTKGPRGEADHVKILDFGVAKINTPEENARHLTRTGTTLGTPLYLAPEQANGSKEVDGRLDIWCAGVLMYEMLTGKLPFPGDGYNEILSKVLLSPYVPLHEHGRTVSPEMANVVDTALAKDKADRFQSAWEMRDALIEVLEVASKEETPAPRRTAPQAQRVSGFRQRLSQIRAPSRVMYSVGGLLVGFAVISILVLTDRSPSSAVIVSDTTISEGNATAKRDHAVPDSSTAEHETPDEAPLPTADEDRTPQAEPPLESRPERPAPTPHRSQRATEGLSQQEAAGIRLPPSPSPLSQQRPSTRPTKTDKLSVDLIDIRMDDDAQNSLQRPKEHAPSSVESSSPLTQPDAGAEPSPGWRPNPFAESDW